MIVLTAASESCRSGSVHEKTSSPRRFAFVVNSKNPMAAWSVLEELKRNFPKHEVDVFNVSHELKDRKLVLAACVIEALAGYPSDILRGRKRLRDAVFRTSQVESFAKRLVAATVRPETHDFVFQMQSLWSARVPNVPHFLYTDHTNHTHTSYPDFDKGAIYGKKFRARESKLYREATTVFTRSSNVTDDIIEFYGASPGRIQCVFAGANTEHFAESIPYQIKKRPDIRTVLFVGIDWERKGGPDLVDAFRNVASVHEGARLVIVGCNPNNLPGDLPIHVVGRVPGEQLAQYYREADIFCMPTLREPFGISFIEAMSFGLPIVATRIGAIPDFVIPGHNGILVEPRNSHQIADALLKLLNDSGTMQKFGQRSAEIARKKYNWRNSGNMMAQRIRSELKNAPR